MSAWLAAIALGAVLLAASPAAAQDPLILSIKLSKPAVCVGELLEVAVTAQHPTTPSIPVQVYVDGSPGQPQYLQFHAPQADRKIHVVAHTPDHLKDVREAEVDVVPCPGGAAHVRLSVQRNPYHRHRVDFRARPWPGRRLRVRRYDWTFGDGTVAHTTEPWISHDYAPAMDLAKQYSEFLVTVTAVTTAGVPPPAGLVAKRRIALASQYWLSLGMGFVQAELVAGPPPPDGGVVGSFLIKNPHPEPIVLDRYLKHDHPCDPAQPVRWEKVSALSVFGPAVLSELAPFGYPWDPESGQPAPTSPGELVVNPGSFRGGRFDLPIEKIAPGVCVVGYTLIGRTHVGRIPLKAYASAYFEVRRNQGRAQVVSDPVTLSMLTALRDQQLVADEDRISTEELYVLQQRRKVRRTPAGWKVIP
jgi:hypothetical protein